MAESWQCTSMYIDGQYIAGNDLDWEPDESTQFVAEISNTEDDVTCDATVRFKLLGGDLDGGEKLIHTETKSISGNKNTFAPKFGHGFEPNGPGSDILSDVPPGVYNFEVVVNASEFGEEADSQVWRDDNGDPHNIVIYEEDGTHPEAEPNIVVTDVQPSTSDAVVGETVNVDIDFENTGDASGSDSYELECNGNVIATLDVKLDSGSSHTETVGVEMPDDDHCSLRIGGSEAEINIVQNPIQNTDLSVNSGVNRIDASYSWTNVAETDVQFELGVDITDIDTDSVIFQKTYTITAKSSSSGSKDFGTDTSVQSGKSRDFEVCAEIQ